MVLRLHKNNIKIHVYKHLGEADGGHLVMYAKDVYSVYCFITHIKKSDDQCVQGSVLKEIENCTSSHRQT